MNVYDIGDLVDLRAYFTQPSDGVALDPTTVNLSVRRPSGEVTTYTYSDDVQLAKASTGEYYAQITVDEEGIWYYRWWSSGVGQAAEEDSFEVRGAMAL